MSPRVPLLLVLAALLLPGPLVAHAETRRIAVLVGNNVGGGARPPLRFAETDASKLARVLEELGDVAAEDLFLLQGKGLTQLRDVLGLATRRIASSRANPGTRVVLLFYFSGHSDGVALELGRERLTFSALREWLEKTGAEVRLAIVDSCKSGALLRAKGGKPGPAFQIKLTDDLSSAGQVLLSSSSEDEVALESQEIGGSFFTHHLVSGLRGAADTSGDGQVTLTEAYQYAFSSTVTTTSNTFMGGQHPAYDYRLSGQGELVLTQVHAPVSALELPEGFERALLLQRVREQVLAELPAGVPRRVALPPGEYGVRLWKGGRLHVARVRVARGEVRSLRWEELAVEGSPAAVTRAKGEELPVPAVAPGAPPAAPSEAPVTRMRGLLSLGPGLRGTFFPGGTLMPLLHLSLLLGPRHGLAVGLELGTARVDALRETAGQLSLGYRWTHVQGHVLAYVGVEAVGQFVQQSSGGAVRGWSLNPGVGPWSGISWAVAGPVRMGLEVHVPLVRAVLDGKAQARLTPSGRLGLAFALP
jgi:hypothetical protein